MDYPGFNLRLARRLRALGIPVLYYICPQVWAWHRRRIRTLAKVAERLITIFPFEAAYFSGTGLRVDYVGHPLVERVEAARVRPEDPLPWNGRPRVALLPGSREQVIRRLLPVLWDAARRLQCRYPEAAFIFAAPDTPGENLLRMLTRERTGGPRRWAIVTGRTLEVLGQADAAVIASGTATVEAALQGCPMVVVYRTPWLNYLFARVLVRVDTIGMVNIIAGECVCPERIQAAATPSAIANAIEPLLTDTPERRRMQEALQRVAAALGKPGAADRAAACVLETLQFRNPSCARST